jgi:hypothetical protein
MNFYYFILDYQNKRGQDFNHTVMTPYLTFSKEEEAIAGKAAIEHIKRQGYENIKCLALRLKRPISFDQLNSLHPDSELIAGMRIIEGDEEPGTSRLFSGRTRVSPGNN